MAANQHSKPLSDDDLLPADAKQAQLTKICASETFRAAPMLCAMLKYVVNETVAGRAAELKEYTVGVGGLGRHPSLFNPTLDTSVRTQATRLREKLAKYYDGEGARDPIRITMPKPGYAVRFECQGSRPQPSLVRTAKRTDGNASSGCRTESLDRVSEIIRVRIRSFHTGTETELAVPNTATIDWFSTTAADRLGLARCADLGAFEPLPIRWSPVEAAVFEHWEAVKRNAPIISGMFVNDVDLLVATRSDWKEMLLWFSQIDDAAEYIREELAALPYALCFDPKERLVEFGVRDGCTFYLAGIPKPPVKWCAAIQL